MANPIIEALKVEQEAHADQMFTLFTLGGHLVTGHIRTLGDLIILEAGKEVAQVPADRVEAFSRRPL